MVEEGEETVVFRLCSCLSTLVSPEQGLEGKLADLRWDAIAVMEGEVPFYSSGMKRREEAVLQRCLELAIVYPYIYRKKCHGIADIVDNKNLTEGGELRCCNR
jgi:hypothetical protein